MTCSPTQLVYQALTCAGITPNDYPHHLTGGGNTLPFTGFDLTLVVLAGLFLIVLGVSLRRIGRDGA